VNGKKKPKYTGFTWSSTGITVEQEIPRMAKVMVVMLLLYLIIEIPAFIFRNDNKASTEEHPYAMIGFIASVVAFFSYSYFQMRDASSGEIVSQLQLIAARNDWKRRLAHHVVS
jgi:glucan phosphoethanolaminetransferase (alkaline phosphatase superfamily)